MLRCCEAKKKRKMPGSRAIGKSDSVPCADVDVVDSAVEMREIKTSVSVPTGGQMLSRATSRGLSRDRYAKGRLDNFNYNVFSAKKSAAQGLMDVALLMANASQLKHVLNMGVRYKYLYFMMILLCTSIIMQLIVGIALLILARVKLLRPTELMHYEEQDREHNRQLQAQARSLDFEMFADSPTARGPKAKSCERRLRMRQLKDMGTSTEDDGILDFFRTSPHRHVNVIRAHKKADFLNDLVTGCIFVLLVVNTFISSFGLTNPGEMVSTTMREEQASTAKPTGNFSLSKL